jgi:DNA-binding response OmpR family regulator
MSRILLVEDNVDLAEAIRHNLEFEGHEVRVAHDGEAALATVEAFAPELVVLDVMLPRLDGFQVLRRLREAGNDVPVVMLTARTEEADHVRAFRLDADQYVTKPFRLLELLERISMLLRRAARPVAPPRAAPADGTAPLRFGDVEVHPDARKVLKGGREVALSPRELDLLLALVAASGRVVSRHELLRLVWQYQPGVVTRTVDSHISELRHKLESDPRRPRFIVTVRKAGYRFETRGGAA